MKLKLKMTVGLLLIGGAVLAGPSKTVVRGDVTITTTMTKKYNEAVAEIIIKASPEIIWQVLTDFDNHAGVMPHVVKSTVVARKGNSVVINKEVKAPFRRIPMLIKATLKKLEWILAWEQIKGPLKINRGIYRIKQKGKSCSLSYTVQVKHGYFIPKWIQRKMTEKSMTKLFKVIRSEALRRQKKADGTEISSK